MDNLLSNPTFMVYAVACVVLCLNLVGLWGQPFQGHGHVS